MRDLFKWIDRISAVITVATFAFAVLQFLGATPQVHFDVSDGRKLVLAMVAYEIVMAVAVSGASALLYRWLGNTFAAMIIPIVAWSFVNVDVIKTLFGPNVWAPSSQGWWIFRLNHAQNGVGFGIALAGAALFLLVYTLLFVRRASDHQFQDGGDSARQLARMNAMTVVMGAVITAVIAHIAWIWLAGAKVT